MSRYYNYSRNSYTSDWKSYVGPVLVGLVVLLGITWIIMEFACTRTFVGTLSGKHATTEYSYDELRTVVETDTDENGRSHTHVRQKGSNRTTAHRNYGLTFYSEGALREVSTGSFSKSVPYVRREDLALQALNDAHTVPALWIHSKEKTEYLVTVTGWLLDGTVEDITPIDSIKAE